MVSKTYREQVIRGIVNRLIMLVLVQSIDKNNVIEGRGRRYLNLKYLGEITLID